MVEDEIATASQSEESTELFSMQQKDESKEKMTWLRFEE